MQGVNKHQAENRAACWLFLMAACSINFLALKMNPVSSFETSMGFTELNGATTHVLFVAL
jgi:hypothetical protein